MNAARTQRVDLGIAIAHARFQSSREPVPFRVIAAYCECRWSAIWHIEQVALHKLRRKLHLHQDALLAALKHW